MYFVGGVHGVGKSYWCNMVKESAGVECYSASTLIKEQKKQGFPADKRVADIDENQLYLLAAVDALKAKHGEFLLDGHFCLLNQDGRITRISLDILLRLRPEAIILLTEKPETIVERLRKRDFVEHSASVINAFQAEECKYAEEVATLLNVPLFITNSNETNNTIEFIRDRRAKPNGRQI